MDKEAKKMNYAIEPIRKILLTEAIIDGGTQKKADALEGKWIRINEHIFAFVEESQTTLVYSDKNDIGSYEDLEVGCACDRFKDSDKLLCEHIIAFDNLKSTPQLTIESKECRWLQEYLFSLGWYSENRYLYPSLDAELPEDEAKEELAPVNEDKSLDTEVDEEQEPKMYERKCAHCGFVSKGYDIDKVKQRIDEHRKTCPKNPANKKKNPNLVTQEASDSDVTVDETDVPIVPEKKPPVEKPKKEDKKTKPPSKKTESLFDWIENLVEFGVCQIFGDTGTAKTAVCRELAEQAADEGKKVVYWDTEGNMTRKQRAMMTEHKNITFILDRDWDHIKNMLSSDLSKGSPKLPKCDLFILDSIGVPVLGIYGTLKQNQKGNALQAMQGLMYQLTKFAEKNDAVVVVTNQPVSEMNKTPEQIANRHPFGDKAMFFTKEILKMVIGERTEYKTICHIIAWRSRSAGFGKMLCTVTVSDSGVEVTPTGGE